MMRDPSGRVFELFLLCWQVLRCLASFFWRVPGALVLGSEGLSSGTHDPDG